MSDSHENSAARLKTIKALNERVDGVAAEQFESAYRVAAEESIPDRLAMSALAIRELMDRIEKSVGLSIGQPDWRSAIRNAAKKGLSASVANVAGLGDAAPSSSNESASLALQELLDSVEEVPTRKKIGGLALESLDPSGGPVAPVVALRRAATWATFRKDFNAVLHHDFKPTGGDFVSRLDEFSTFICHLLLPKAFEEMDEMDALLEAGPSTVPRGEDVLKEMITRSPASYRYFFQQANTEWLQALMKAGFFKAPMPPERGDDWIRFPDWPESAFLARVAGEAPDDVFQVCRSISPSENIRVHEDLVGVALFLDGNRAAELAKTERIWLSGQYGVLMSLPYRLADLVVHLAERDQVGEAVKLASVLLDILPATDANKPRRAVARTDEYLYAKTIEKCWPALSKVDAKAPFSMLCDKLGDAAEAGYIDADNGFDATQVWRSSIRSHEQNLGHTLFDALVDAVRDYSLEIAEEGHDGFACVHDSFAARSLPIFERLDLHLIAAQGSVDEKFDALSNIEFARRLELWPEYSHLLESAFADLPPEKQERLLDILESEDTRLAVKASYRDDIDGAERDRFAQLWLRDRLALVHQSLTGEHKKLWEALAGEFGEPSNPDFLSFRSRWAGDTTPFESAELSELSPLELVARISGWTPEGQGFDSPSHEGLAGAVTGAISTRPLAYSSEASTFSDLPPQYLHAIVGGFHRAASAGEEIDWAKTIEFCTEITKRFATRGDPAEGSDDQFAAWTVQEIAWLINEALGDHDRALPLENRTAMWKLIESIAMDPDPTPAHAAKYGGANMDPSQLSLNSVRGQAIHASVRYLLWIERHSNPDAGIDMRNEAPEVDALLRSHLDPSYDPSLAVRAPYGQWFPQLVRLDEAWATELAPLVFPNNNNDLFAAAWGAYVTLNSAYTSVFNVLRGQYRIAASSQTLIELGENGRGDAGARLGRHLMFLYMRGVLGLADGDILPIYWSNVSEGTKRGVLNEVGFSLTASGELDPELKTAAVRLWTWIVDATPTAEAFALAAFGEWFRTPGFDPSWLLDSALEVMGRKIALDDSYSIFQRLESFAEIEPAKTMAVLRLMVVTGDEPFRLAGSEQRIANTLERALASGDGAAVSDARDVLGLLGAKGLSDLRRLAS